MKKMTLSEISIYPIKSTAQYRLKSSEVEMRGLAFDRRWMLVDGQGQFLTQRQFPQLALISTLLAGDSLLVSADKQKDLLIPLLADSQLMRVQVKVWQDTVSALHLGDEYDAWFTKFLGVPCHLVYMDDEAIRIIDQQYALDESQQVSFSDGFPLLLISNASLEDLNGRLDQSVSMQQFRPNVVVNGCEPFDEDRWQKIRIGEIEFAVVKPCSRCVVTTIDPKTALKNPAQEPLKTLASYRKQGEKVYFGQNLIPLNAGKIRLGDCVEVIE